MEYQVVKEDNFLRRRTKTEKLLCALLCLVILITIILGVVLIMTLMKEPKIGDLCQTKDCLTASTDILRNMDTEIDPCHDFYEFACGNYIKTAVVPPSKTLIDAFSSQSKIIDKQIHSSLEEPISPNDSRTIKLVRKVYEVCMNETAREVNSMNTIKNHLKRLGGWPVVEGTRWREANFDWIETLLTLRDTGLAYNFFMDFNVEVDNKNSSKRILSVDQPFVPFEAIKRGPRNHRILDASHRFMVDIAVEFGAEKNLAEKEMDDILNFDMELVKIMVPPEDRRDLEEEYHPISIRELEERYGILPWHRFVNRIIAPSSMTYDDNLIIYLPEYLRKLRYLIGKSSKRLLANYILYKVVGFMLPYSNKKLKEIQLQYMKVTVGIGSSAPKTEECVSVASRLDIAVGALYISKYFDKKAKANTEEIVKNIENKYMETLQKVDWMDSDTRKAALEKLQAMGKYVGYPDELLDDSKLEEYYKDLEINSDNFVEVMLNISKFQTVSEMKQLSEPVVKSDWRTRSSVAVVNAFYDLNANAIQVPAGILQGVFFNAKRPQYLNYGGIGYIIGHEFTHGFDDEGSQMDKDGNLREWWKNDTKDAYDKKAKCIVDQYSSFVIPEVNMTINGINTQGENIADNGGIKVAYLAYQDWTKKNKLEPKLPGLNYTPNQMFWIGAANVWCSKMKTEAMEQEVLSEVHPPDRFRINVPFANSGFFAKDFNCPKNSNMNPGQRCTVW